MKKDNNLLPALALIAVGGVTAYYVFGAKKDPEQPFIDLIAEVDPLKLTFPVAYYSVLADSIQQAFFTGLIGTTENEEVIVDAFLSLENTDDFFMLVGVYGSRGDAGINGLPFGIYFYLPKTLVYSVTEYLSLDQKQKINLHFSDNLIQFSFVL